MADIEVAAAVLTLWMVAILRELSGTMQGAVVEAMTVSVTGGERQPVRSPLGQGRLQAVVVGTGIVRHVVDNLQVWEARIRTSAVSDGSGATLAKGTETRFGINLIEVVKAN